MSTFNNLNTDISKNNGQISLYDDVVLGGLLERTNFGNGIKLKSDNLVIDGNNHTIDAKGKIPIFEISAKNITLKNINFKNGFAKKYGGAIRIDTGGSCKIINCTFENNSAKKGGNDISSGGEVFISNCKFSHTNSINNKGSVYTLKDEVEDLKPFVSGGSVLISTFNISVSVMDDDDNNPVNGAVLSIGDKTATTNENGSCSVEDVYEGVNEVKVNAKGYEDYSRSIDISSDNTIFSFILSRITHNVSFNISSDEEEPLEGAIVAIDEKSCTTDKNGNCIIKGVNSGANKVKVSAEGYVHLSINVNVSSDNDDFSMVLSKLSSGLYPCFDQRPFQAYYGQHPYIFVSYSHKDACEVFQELRRFHDLGLNIWYDEGITSGKGWQEEVENAVIGSSLFVVFISNDSIESENVREEIFLAKGEEIPIIPIFLEETELRYGLRLRLEQVQSIYKYALPEDQYLEMCKKGFARNGIDF